MMRRMMKLRTPTATPAMTMTNGRKRTPESRRKIQIHPLMVHLSRLLTIHLDRGVPDQLLFHRLLIHKIRVKQKDDRITTTTTIVRTKVTGSTPSYLLGSVPMMTAWTQKDKTFYAREGLGRRLGRRSRLLTPFLVLTARTWQLELMSIVVEWESKATEKTEEGGRKYLGGGIDQHIDMMMMTGLRRGMTRELSTAINLYATTKIQIIFLWMKSEIHIK